MTEQAETLLKIAKRIHKKKYARHIGEPVENSSEKVQLYISYPPSRCKKDGDLWDIPRYTNGSTRPAKCVFLIPYRTVGDGCHPYLVSNGNSEMEKRFEESPLYDREKVLITEKFGRSEVDIVWSFDFGPTSSQGQWFYNMGDFWFGVRVDGKLVSKANSISDLKIPDSKQTCIYCERTRALSKMELVRFNEWMCKDPEKRLYSSCPK